MGDQAGAGLKTALFCSRFSPKDEYRRKKNTLCLLSMVVKKGNSSFWGKIKSVATECRVKRRCRVPALMIRFSAILL
jgi:hypothetical protein